MTVPGTRGLASGPGLRLLPESVTSSRARREPGRLDERQCLCARRNERPAWTPSRSRPSPSGFRLVDTLACPLYSDLPHAPWVYTLLILFRLPPGLRAMPGVTDGVDGRASLHPFSLLQVTSGGPPHFLGSSNQVLKTSVRVLAPPPKVLSIIGKLLTSRAGLHIQAGLLWSLTLPESQSL